MFPSIPYDNRYFLSYHTFVLFLLSHSCIFASIGHRLLFTLLFLIDCLHPSLFLCHWPFFFMFLFFDTLFHSPLPPPYFLYVAASSTLNSYHFLSSLIPGGTSPSLTKRKGRVFPRRPLHRGNEGQTV